MKSTTKEQMKQMDFDNVLVTSLSQYKKGDYFMRDDDLMTIHGIQVIYIDSDFGRLLLRKPTESERRDYKLNQLGI